MLSHTFFVPVQSPPTPAPSPSPLPAIASPALRRDFLDAFLRACSPADLLYISATIAPLLKRDFLRDLPPELAIHVLRFVDDPRSLARAAQVSIHWNALLAAESLWKGMCIRYRFTGPQDQDEDDLGLEDDTPFIAQSETGERRECGYYKHVFKHSYITRTNWRKGGELLCAHRVVVVPPDTGVITSLALDADWVVVGLANSKIHIFNARTGLLTRTLVGHRSGVWGVCLVSKGGLPHKRKKDNTNHSDLLATHLNMQRRVAKETQIRHLQEQFSQVDLENSAPAFAPLETADFHQSSGLTANDGNEDKTGSDTSAVEEDEEYLSSSLEPGKRSDMAFASQGWGQPSSLVVSGGCDKVLRVWDVETGFCIYELSGHTSTIRCMRMLHNRPIAVTGSRDGTLRVWNVQRGRCLRVLRGHTDSVRCLDVCGNRVVSGSYDTTCRLWDIDTGRCLHVFSGHFHQVYSIAFDGLRVASGGLDTTVRVWDVETGKCLALLQGHTALVCQLQLSDRLLATGGSDGRVILFCLKTFRPLHRIAAHDSSVTSLQIDMDFLMTGGNDGRVRLFDSATGAPIREMTALSECVWKVACGKETCAVMCMRGGKTVMEIWSMRPRTGQ